MYCVIVGDIVKSRELEPETREKILRAANDAFDHINTEYIASLMASFGMVRGDAFEGVLLTPYVAPKIIQEIIKAFYRADRTIVRVSAVIGELTAFGSDRNETDGPAFHKALDDLEMMKKSKSRHWLQVSYDTHSLAQPLVDNQFRLLAALTEGWTDRQREVAWEMDACEGQQKVVGKRLDITVSVVNKQLRAAHYDAYRSAWEGLEQYLVGIEEDAVMGKPAVKSYLAYYNLGLRKWNEQYNYEGALPLFEKSRDLAIRDLGKDDLQLIPVYNKLSVVYAESSRFYEAAEAINESLRLQEKLPKARQQYVATLQSQAWVYSCEKRDEEAKASLEEALSIARNILNERHPTIGVLNNDLAIAYENLKEYDDALHIYANALAIAEENRDSGTIDYAITNCNIARCYMKMRKFKEAVTYAGKALEIFEENLPPKHKYIQLAQNLIVHCRSTQGGDPS